MSILPIAPIQPPETKASRAPWIALAICLLAPLSAVWSTQAFVTQDGPAHLYNAEIVNHSLASSGPFIAFFSVKVHPLPNWAGHLTTAVMLQLFPPRIADRAMTTLTLVALPIALVWLRVQGRGER